MNLNIIYASSASSMPTAMKAALNEIVQYLQSTFLDPITVNLNVGYGTVAGQAMDAGALGESSTFLNSYTYTQIRNALIADAKSSDDSSAVNSLGTTDPLSGTHTYWL